MVRRWVTASTAAAALLALAGSAPPVGVPLDVGDQRAASLSPVSLPAAASSDAAPDWATAADLDRWIADRRAALKLPALAVVVLAGGRTLLEATYGEATPGVPVTLDTPFRLGSTTKQLTGLVVQSLVAQGRLDLETTAVSVLPELAGGDPRWSAVTVRHLLTHRSGLQAHATLAEQTLWPSTRTVLQEAVRIAHEEPFTSEPGTAFEYDDAGYTVLGAIVERVTGTAFEEALQDLVVRPLDMSATTTDRGRALAEGVARDEYTWFGLVNLPTPGPSWPVAAPGAGATSTAHDLTTLLRAYLADSDPVLAAARVPLADGGDPSFRYASGWIVRPLWELTDANEGWQDPSLPTLWEHSGQTTRSLSYLALAPDLGLGVVLLTNTGTGADATRWDVFTDSFVHEIVGTRPGPPVSGAAVHTPPVAVAAVALLALGAIVWLARARRRWLPAAVGGVAGTGLVLVALTEDFSHTSWWGFYPDLAASIGLGLIVAAAYVVVLVVGGVRRGARRSG